MYKYINKKTTIRNFYSFFGEKYCYFLFDFSNFIPIFAEAKSQACLSCT
nr:MAG TPA: hypothetical protein [Caudoviricetes sp.]